jgi:hypothetical protein
LVSQAAEHNLQTMTLNRMPLKTLWSLTALALVSAASGHAGPVSITNPSFENPTLSPGNFFIGVNGWTLIDGGGFNVYTYNPSGTALGSAPDGDNIAEISGNNIAPDAGITQILTATLEANTTYTLTFDVIHLVTTTMDPYLGSLIANGVTLASDNSLDPALNQYALDTIVYNSGPDPAELGQALTITLVGAGCTSGPGCESGVLGFDNVALDASPTPTGSPEPATFVFVLAGVVALGLGRRFRVRVPAARQVR